MAGREGTRDGGREEYKIEEQGEEGREECRKAGRVGLKLQPTHSFGLIIFSLALSETASTSGGGGGRLSQASDSITAATVTELSTEGLAASGATAS